MPSEHDPGDCLADIVDNIERIESYTADCDRQASERDGRTRDAVERCLERVCEAVARLGKRAAELLPEQPLGQIRGMGNQLRHAYDRISNEILWHTVRDRLPSLRADAQQALTKLEAPRHGS